MIIKLSPVRSDDLLSVVAEGDSLTVNGSKFDFAQLQNGEVLPRSAIQSTLFDGDVTRVDGALQVTLRFPHGPHADEAARFPVPISVTQDGPVQLPSSGHEMPMPLQIAE